MAAPRGFLSCHRLLVLSVTPHSPRQTAPLRPDVRNGAIVIIASVHRAPEHRSHHRTAPQLSEHHALAVSSMLQKNRWFSAQDLPPDCAGSVPQRAVLHAKPAAEQPQLWCHQLPPIRSSAEVSRSRCESRGAGGDRPQRTADSVRDRHCRPKGSRAGSWSGIAQKAAMQLSPLKPGGSRLANRCDSWTRLFDPEGV
jgi:hypothetical protein